MSRFLIIVLLSTGCALSTTAPAAAAESGWAFSLGVFDVIDSDTALEAGLEYWWPPFELWFMDLTPVVGVSGTDEGSFWAYSGMRWDLLVGGRWLVTPSFAVSVYEEGDGRDLGGPIEFRSGLDVAYRFANESRLGVSFYHLSNGRLYDLNPGSESLVVTWSTRR